MEIQVSLDDALVKDVRVLTGIGDDARAVEQILRRVLAGRRKHLDLLDLVGKIEFYEGFDPKTFR